jgi:hypothetical protein
MSSSVRLGSALFALLIPGSILAYWSAHSDPAALRFDPRPISRELTGYTQTGENELEPEVLAQIKPDLYRMWLYTREGRPPIRSYLAFYRGIVFTGAHDPAVCYPSGSRDLKLPMQDGGTLSASLLRVHLRARKELVLYWFQTAGRWPKSAWAEQILRVYDTLRGSPQYAFVRLSAPATPETEDLLIHFAREAAPQVRAVLETARPLDR